tara:strand:+ start:2108 stop:3580 length:1473 start_codon:yes stop_codon:yes gene_type:complete
MIFKYIPITFIKNENEIKTQIRNTLLFKYIFQKFNDVRPLDKLLEKTQYGYNASAGPSGQHKFLRITDINEWGIDWETVPFVNCDNEDSYLLKNEDILIARTGGTTGKSALIKKVPNNAIFAGYLIRLSVNDNIIPDFLNLFLNSYSYWSQIFIMKKGSAQPNVNAKKLRELQMPFCEKEYQEEILDLLKDGNRNNRFKELNEEIDNTIKNYDYAQKILEIYKKQYVIIDNLRSAILNEAIQGKLVPQDPNDEPASELLKRIKAEKEQLIAEKKIKKDKPLSEITDDEIPYELPSGWEWCRLINICNLITDGTHHTPTYQSFGVPFLSVKDISKGQIDFSNTRYISETEHDNLIQRCNPEFEDVLLTKVGTTGIAKVIDIKKTFSIFVSVALLKFNKTNIFPYYLEYLLNSPLVKIQSKEGTRGVGNKNLVLRKIKAFIVPIPPISEQKRIVAKVDELMTLCDQLETQIQESKENADLLMQSVLQEAFAA